MQLEIQYDSWEFVFFIIGVLFVFYFIIVRFVWLFIQYFILQFFETSLEDRARRCGSWAVVTGSTDGIGMSYAFQLAQARMNVFLISRNSVRLENFRKELVDTFPTIQVRVLTFDFTQNAESYDLIRKQLSNLDDIGILVNNVGAGYDHPEKFSNISDKECTDMINCNVLSTTLMTHMILPKMFSRRRGVILNISSGAGIAPMPLMTVYAATKNYIDTFSRALRIECRGTGVQILCTAPFFVSTKMSKLPRVPLLVPSPAAYVREAVRRVGVQWVAYDHGSLSHNLQGFFIRLLFPLAPSWLLLRIMNYQRNVWIRLSEEQRNKRSQ